ncbi:MAG TPA: ATP-dependent helicase [Anaerolineales bacterium]|nr:ATP-dependent helicase [Anaerolineales bacterium]
MTDRFSPRPSQSRILEYAGGMLGIAAVPGSGKTHTLSALAADLIESGRLGADQEILIVTLVNSAVENFKARLSSFAAQRGLIPRLGYRVRTLHGLAHDIVRENPPLAGLDKQFIILDETASSAMIRDAARSWALLHPDIRDLYLRSDLDATRLRQVTAAAWPELVEGIAASFIRSAKDRRLSPAGLWDLLERLPASLPLARMGGEIYADYQRALVYRGAVDFDDLVRLAADMLTMSPELLEALRFRWPFILEDEAQDSSQLQQEILSMLAGPNGNWVRVGDPNQAIFETFTTANPQLLRDFIDGHSSVPMPESGRSQPAIMNLANFLVQWTQIDHPVEEVRPALGGPLIIPTPPGDPQPNPPDNPGGISFLGAGLTSREEILAVAESLQEWLPAHRDSTVAVLAATNDHAANMVRALQARAVPCRELLRSTSPTRAAAGALSHVLTCLAHPGQAGKLAQAYRVYRRDWRSNEQLGSLSDRVALSLAGLRQVEAYLAPLPSQAGAEGAQEQALAGSASVAGNLAGDSEAAKVELEHFREVVARWQSASMLPIDQLIQTIAQEIFTSATDLALAHKLGLVLVQMAAQNPGWRLPELVPQLNQIARNERKFLGFSADDTGFEPDQHRGEVVVTTMHKAKGLEWDRVYLISVNDYDFPGAETGDRFRSEKWFIRDGLNLEAEALAQLHAAFSTSEWQYYQEGASTRAARLEYARERLRLLYVGITRARKELILTWNRGRRGDARPAPALVALQDWWASAHPSSLRGI